MTKRLIQIIEVNMKVGPGISDKAQVYCGSESSGGIDESRSKRVGLSLRVGLIGDGEFHTYSFDMSKIAGWDGLITEIQIYPLSTSGTDIEIDYIRFA